MIERGTCARSSTRTPRSIVKLLNLQDYSRLKVYIQQYVLPEWRNKIKELPDNLEEKYETMGKSMAEYLDRQMMRKLPKNWFEGWLRYHFPLKVDQKILDMHKVIADNFGEFVSLYRSGEIDDFSIPEDDIEEIETIKSKLDKQKEEKEKEINSLREEVRNLRDAQRPEGKKKRKRKQKKQVSKKPISQKSDVVISSKSANVDNDWVYEKWMEHVDQKSISKSYWHIHEYMSRYILEFAEKHNPKGNRLTEELLEDFLEEYGKGKRPKTMNHYNRVARYFWDFYDDLVNSDES